MEPEQKNKNIAARVGALLALAITFSLAASPTVQAWGAWGSWQPIGTTSTCVSNSIGSWNFSGMAIAYTDASQTLKAITPGSCGHSVQGQAWPSQVTVTAHTEGSSWYTASTVSPTNITYTRCRAQLVIC